MIETKEQLLAEFRRQGAGLPDNRDLSCGIDFDDAGSNFETLRAERTSRPGTGSKLAQFRS